MDECLTNSFLRCGPDRRAHMSCIFYWAIGRVPQNVYMPVVVVVIFRSDPHSHQAGSTKKFYRIIIYFQKITLHCRIASDILNIPSQEIVYPADSRYSGLSFSMYSSTVPVRVADAEKIFRILFRPRFRLSRRMFPLLRAFCCCIVNTAAIIAAARIAAASLFNFPVFVLRFNTACRDIFRFCHADRLRPINEESIVAAEF